MKRLKFALWQATKAASAIAVAAAAYGVFLYRFSSGRASLPPSAIYEAKATDVIVVVLFTTFFITIIERDKKS